MIVIDMMDRRIQTPIYVFDDITMKTMIWHEMKNFVWYGYIYLYIIVLTGWPLTILLGGNNVRFFVRNFIDFVVFVFQCKLFGMSFTYS